MSSFHQSDHLRHWSVVNKESRMMAPAYERIGVHTHFRRKSKRRKTCIEDNIGEMDGVYDRSRESYLGPHFDILGSGLA